MRKVKKKYIAIVFIVLLLLIECLSPSTGIITFRYNNIENALAKGASEKFDKIDKILYDNDYALAIYTTKDASFSDDFLSKNDKGWTVVTRQIWRYKKYIKVNEYGLYYIKYKGINLIEIDADTNKKFTYPKYPNPKDSINSDFKYCKINIDDTTSFSYWFLVLNNLPDNYYIKLNDKNVRLN